MNRFRYVHAATAATLGLVISLPLVGCDDNKPNTKLAPSASALASSKSESKKALVWPIAKDGKATFQMDGKIETIKGDVSSTKGELQLDLTDLKKTRGVISMDMQKLVTKTFEEEGKNKKQNEHALTWLEVSEGNNKPEVIKANRWAHFAIRSIDSAEPNDLSKGTGAKRTAKVKATGDLLLHGHKSSHTVELIAEFTFEGAKATGVSVKTGKPFVINLASHEVKPRDPGGILVQKVSDILKQKVAETANVTLDLKATNSGKTASGEVAMPTLPSAAPAPSGSGSAAAAPSASAGY